VGYTATDVPWQEGLLRQQPTKVTAETFVALIAGALPTRRRDIALTNTATAQASASTASRTGVAIRSVLPAGKT